MRLFHHFIMTAYPHLPLGNGDVWVREIPAFAHSVSFFSWLLGLHCLNLYSHLTVRFPPPSNACPFRLPPSHDHHLRRPERKHRTVLPRPRNPQSQCRPIPYSLLQRRERRDPRHLLCSSLPNLLPRRIDRGISDDVKRMCVSF